MFNYNTLLRGCILIPLAWSACEETSTPPPTSCSLDTQFLLLDSTNKNLDGASHHSCKEKLELPTTTCNELGKELPTGCTKILAQCRLVIRAVSTMTNPPHSSPIFLNTIRLQRCNGKPNTLTHISLARPPLPRQPASRVFLAKCGTLSLTLQEPLASTLSASIRISKSNKGKVPPKPEIFTPFQRPKSSHKRTECTCD